LAHIISYTLDLVPLIRLDEVNDLGILFDHKLKFDTHVALTVAFSVRQLKFLGSSKDGKNLMTLIRKNYYMYL